MLDDFEQNGRIRSWAGQHWQPWIGQRCDAGFVRVRARSVGSRRSLAGRRRNVGVSAGSAWRAVAGGSGVSAARSGCGAAEARGRRRFGLGAGCGGRREDVGEVGVPAVLLDQLAPIVVASSDRPAR